MIEMIWDQLKGVFDNQLVSGGLVLTVMASMMYYVKMVIPFIRNRLKRRFVFSVEVRNTDSAYRWIEEWLSVNNIVSKVRNTRLVSGKSSCNYDSPSIVGSNNNERKEELPYYFSVSGGTFLIFINKIPVLVSKSSENSGGDKSGFAALLEGMLETLSFSTFSFYRKRLEQAIEEMYISHKSKNKRVPSLYMANYNSWRFISPVFTKPIKTVVLRSGLSQNVINDVDSYLNNEDDYIRKSIPYKRGYLFSGPPGTGKSSFIMALANYFNKDIYYFYPSDKTVSDKDIPILLSEVSNNNFLVIEDIDAIGSGVNSSRDDKKSNEENKGITLTGLLNALDGIIAPEKRILFITTNYPEKLDKALVRAGRIDKHVTFDYADKTQVELMYRNFFPNASNDCVETFTDSVNHGREISPAEIQEMLIELDTN